MLNLSQKQSNAWHYLEDKTTSEVLYGGAAGGGKTFLLCLWHITRRVKYPGSRGMIGRAKISALEESTLITLFDVAKLLGYQDGIDFKYNQQKHIIIWSNGSRTILKDLFLYPSDPDFTSLGSTEYTDACIDEVSEVCRKAKEIVSSRIRYKLEEFGLEPKLYMSCNPGEGWVKEDYVINGDKPVVLKPHQKFIQALVDDNPDKAFVDRYKKSLGNLTSDYDKQRLLFGDWEATRDVSNPFATSYDKKKHEHVLVKFDPSKQLIISIDFNLNPFGVIFAQIYRIGNVDCCYIFDELSIPNGSIPEMIDQIKNKYGKYLSGCFITGDYMGNNKNIQQRDHSSNYEQLRRGLGLSTAQVKTPVNPTHANSRADVNYILTHFPEFKINPITCPNTCRDLRVVQCDAFGEIIKKNRKDINQLADHLDCVRYLINTFLRTWKTNDMKKR